MKEILAKLQKPLTRADIDFRVGADIDFRVGSVGKGSTPFATILAYKDARTDMRILDEATDGMWQNEYRRDSKGILQCGIGIYYDSQWVWKWSNGMPSNQEAEKGEYSDAFKRAGFMWGIGRDLYDVPQLFVTLREGEYYMEGTKVKATSKLKPNSWEWEISEDLKHFVAKDKQGIRVSVDESEVSEASQTAPNAPGSSQVAWTVESAGQVAVTLKGQVKKISELEPSALDWVRANHKNEQIKSAAQFYHDNVAPF